VKKITLEKAFDIIQHASALIINDSTLLYPGLWELTGTDDNEFLYLSWEEDGLEYHLTFTEGQNREVEVSGSSLFLYDTNADDETCHTQITILQTANLE
jgi:hypothetical protein